MSCSAKGLCPECDWDLLDLAVQWLRQWDMEGKDAGVGTLHASSVVHELNCSCLSSPCRQVRAASIEPRIEPRRCSFWITAAGASASRSISHTHIPWSQTCMDTPLPPPPPPVLCPLLLFCLSVLFLASLSLPRSPSAFPPSNANQA